MSKKDKENRIKGKRELLEQIFTGVDDNKMIFINSLIKELAFMSVTLEDLQDTLNGEGAVELFVNGKQEMLREHPASKIYNTMIKNYNATIKQLIDLVPDKKKAENKLKALMDDE